MTVLGIILFSQLGWIVEFRGGDLLNTYLILSFSMTLIGLLGMLIGGVAWARRAPTRHLLLSAVLVGIVTILLPLLVGINIHGLTAILLLVVFAGALGCVLILFIAADRLGQRNGEK